MNSKWPLRVRYQSYRGKNEKRIFKNTWKGADKKLALFTKSRNIPTLCILTTNESISISSTCFFSQSVTVHLALLTLLMLQPGRGPRQSDGVSSICRIETDPQWDPYDDDDDAGQLFIFIVCVCVYVSLCFVHTNHSGIIKGAGDPILEFSVQPWSRGLLVWMCGTFSIVTSDPTGSHKLKKAIKFLHCVSNRYVLWEQ